MSDDYRQIIDDMQRALTSARADGDSAEMQQKIAEFKRTVKALRSELRTHLDALDALDARLRRLDYEQYNPEAYFAEMLRKYAQIERLQSLNPHHQLWRIRSHTWQTSQDHDLPKRGRAYLTPLQFIEYGKAVETLLLEWCQAVDTTDTQKHEVNAEYERRFEALWNGIDEFGEVEADE